MTKYGNSVMRRKRECISRNSRGQIRRFWKHDIVDHALRVYCVRCGKTLKIFKNQKFKKAKAKKSKTEKPLEPSVRKMVMIYKSRKEMTDAIRIKDKVLAHKKLSQPLEQELRSDISILSSLISQAIA